MDTHTHTHTHRKRVRERGREGEGGGGGGGGDIHTSALYILMRPELTLVHSATELMPQRALECSANGPVFTCEITRGGKNNTCTQTESVDPRDSKPRETERELHSVAQTLHGSTYMEVYGSSKTNSSFMKNHSLTYDVTCYINLYLSLCDDTSITTNPHTGYIFYSPFV